MVRSDGTGLKLIHQKGTPMEVAGHEFWGADGKTIWYDLYIVQSKYFWIVGYDISTGLCTGYQLQPHEQSVHYNVSADGRLFSGDGKAVIKGGKWIYLFHPMTSSNQLYSERLVNMANNDYSTEPNAVFTPDMKWIIFRSNMSGVDQVYAVEIKGAAVRSSHRDY
jgi:oligogalacturonide lyase